MKEFISIVVLAGLIFGTVYVAAKAWKVAGA